MFYQHKVSSQVTKHVLKTPRGIAKWKNQIVDGKMKKGFNFNIMCIGEDGCGKSTFIHSLLDIRNEAKTELDPSGKFEILKINAVNKESTINIKVIFTKHYSSTLEHGDE